MTDLKSQIIGFGQQVKNRLRLSWLPDASKDRLRSSIRQAELEGLRFAFFARLTAILVVSAWLFWIVPWPRDLYYGAYAFAEKDLIPDFEHEEAPCLSGHIHPPNHSFGIALS